MSLLKKAAINLVAEMMRQEKYNAVFYNLSVNNDGFHPIIEFSNNIELLELEENVQMVISELNIEQLRVLVGLL